MRTVCFAVCLMVSVFSMAAAAQKTVPVEHRGKWVPAKGTCESMVAMVVGPGSFPPGYRGIQAVLLTEFSGQQPAGITPRWMPITHVF